MRRKLIQISNFPIARSSGLGTILLFAVCSHAQQLATMRLDGPMSTAAVSPDGHHIAVNIGRSLQSDDGSWASTESIEILEPASAKVIHKMDLPDAELLKDAPLSSTDGFVGYCGNGKYLVVYDEIQSIYVLDADSLKLESKIKLDEQSHIGVLGVRRITCSANSNLIAVNAYGGPFGWGVVQLFDLVSGRQIAELHQNSSAGTEFQEISLSPDGLKLAILLGNPRHATIKGPNIEIRETKKLALLNRFSTGGAPADLTFSGNSEVITAQDVATGWRSVKRELQLWDIELGKKVRQYIDASRDIEGPISSSTDGNTILASILAYRECTFCNGLEGGIYVKEQRFAVWNKSTGVEIYRSEPFVPIVEPLGPRCIFNQDATTVMVYWPDNVITPRLFPIH